MMSVSIVSVLKDWNGSHETLAIVGDSAYPSEDTFQSRPASSKKSAEAIPNRRNRKGAPKVKTGCLTCRGRRVKCDEGKPECNRCSKFGVRCEGYQDLAKQTSNRKSSVRAIKPRDSDLTALLKDVGAIVGFKNESEWRYFRHFCDDMAEGLTGPFESTLFKTSVPQASEAEPFVRNAILALGALHLSKGEAEKADGRQADQELLGSHEAYAVSQYVKVLKDMRAAIEKHPKDIRQVLVACLLAFCFESLQGHLFTASIHASGGLKLILDIKKDIPALVKHTCAFPGCCSKPAAFEEDLYSAFSGLDIQALLFLDTRPTEIHQGLKAQMTSGIARMPKTLETLKEARTFWQMILRRNCHFIATARAEIIALRAPSDPPASDDGVDSAPLRPGNNPFSASRFKASEIPSHLLKEQKQCFEDIKRFENAAEEIFAKHGTCPEDTSSDGKDAGFFLASILKIQMAMNVLNLGFTFFPPPVSWDLYITEYRTILDLVAKVIPYLLPNPERETTTTLPFRFEVSVVPALLLTANSCRYKPERDRAFKLFDKLGEYREGIWDATLVKHIARWIADLEEGWRDEDGFIPKEGRFVLESGDINLKGRTMKLSGWQGDSEEGEEVFREGVVTW